MAYVYRHIRLDKNEPFYIGIGSDKWHVRANSKIKRNDFWVNIFAKTEIEVDILFDNITYEQAKEKEIEFIKLYGRRDLKTGTLVNLTDGGEGVKNKIFSKEHREKLRVANIYRYSKDYVPKVKIKKPRPSDSEETRKKKADAFRGKKHTDEVKKHLSEIKKGSFKGYIEAYKDGVLYGTYKGTVDCANKLNTQTTHISRCIKYPNKTSKGFTFKRTSQPQQQNAA